MLNVAVVAVADIRQAVRPIRVAPVAVHPIRVVRAAAHPIQALHHVAAVTRRQAVVAPTVRLLLRVAATRLATALPRGTVTRHRTVAVLTAHPCTAVLLRAETKGKPAALHLMRHHIVAPQPTVWFAVHTEVRTQRPRTAESAIHRHPLAQRARRRLQREVITLSVHHGLESKTPTHPLVHAVLPIQAMHAPAVLAVSRLRLHAPCVPLPTSITRTITA